VIKVLEAKLVNQAKALPEPVVCQDKKAIKARKVKSAILVAKVRRVIYVQPVDQEHKVRKGALALRVEVDHVEQLALKETWDLKDLKVIKVFVVKKVIEDDLANLACLVIPVYLVFQDQEVHMVYLVVMDVMEQKEILDGTDSVDNLVVQVNVVSQVLTDKRLSDLRVIEVSKVNVAHKALKAFQDQEVQLVLLESPDLKAIAVSAELEASLVKLDKPALQASRVTKETSVLLELVVQQVSHLLQF